MVSTSYVSSTQAAKLLGISTSTLYRMIENGILIPTKTPGGQRRFELNELKNYLEGSKQIVAPQNPYLSKKQDAIQTESHAKPEEQKSKPQIDPRNTLNDLSGKEWIPATKSYMTQKGLGSKHPHTQIERQHPAPYSFQDISQLIAFFTKKGQTVLDPFGGVGSTAKACALSGRKCTQIELSAKWHELARQRLETEVGDGVSAEHNFIQNDCRIVLKELSTNSYDFIVTSPPYWAILNKKADHKVKRERVSQNLATNYSDSESDLGNIPSYNEFTNVLVNEVFMECARILKQGKYMAIVVSDFRNKSDFISFHSDLIQQMNNRSVSNKETLKLQGVKILVQNHKSLLPYGYPFAYVENIHHQYILIFRKMKNK